MNPIVYQLKSFDENYRLLQKREKHSRILLFADFLRSMVAYGASAADYFEYEFFNKTANRRKTFACWKLKKTFMHTMNDYNEEKASIFNNKVKFLKQFKEYIGRDWLEVATSSYEEFCEFVEKHPTFFVKAQNLSCGKGIRKESVLTDLQEQYEQYRQEDALLEEPIVQHEKMASLYGGAVNTIRFAAAYTHRGVEVLGAVLRCGSGDGCVDNFLAGGFASKIDPESGVVISDGCNIHNQRMFRHPDTKVLFHGFAIPYWDEVKAMIGRAAAEVEGVRYIGWDVAIGENGPMLVEGNFEGMFNILQVPADQGIKDKVLDILRYEAQYQANG